jgi:hypothetical protein
MGRIDRAADLVDELTPFMGVAGGLLFAAYWFVRAREVALPHGLGVLLDISTVVLLGTAVLGYQLAQGLRPGAWVGWAGVAAVLEGLVSSPPGVCLGLLLLGIAIARCGVHPRVPGVIMAVSGAALSLSYFLSAGFGRGYGDPGPLTRVVTAMALTGIAASLLDLLVLERQPRHVH